LLREQKVNKYQGKQRVFFLCLARNGSHEKQAKCHQIYPVKHHIVGFDRSDYFLELVPGEFAISQDLDKKSTSNCFTTVYRYYCASAIRMT